MKKTPEQIAKEWLYFAKSDLRLAQLAFGDKIFHEACFMSQQATEKSLKAVLAKRNLPIPKTHSIRQLAKLTSVELPEEAKFLDQFYLPSRYPDALPGSLPEGLPQKDDAAKAFAVAEKTLALIKNLLAKN